MSAKIWNKKSKITSALRQVWRWSPLPHAARQRAKLGRNSYQCAHCNKIWGIKEIRVDHIDTVVPLNWEVDDWTVYVARLFCSVDGLQVLCIDCHAAKTKQERAYKKLHKLNVKIDPASH